MRVLVLGSYGNFGRILCARLSKLEGVTLIAAGRNASQLRRHADELACEAAVLDTEYPDLADRLLGLRIDLLISTAGPFQQQDYRVPRACIDAGVHYIDIADARRYVCDIVQLDAAARARDVLVVSGASSVPALSSAVIDHLQPEFSQLRSIEHGITSSEYLPGVATVAAVLSYCGDEFPQWSEGRWQSVYGWQNLRRIRMAAPLSGRWFANCDVPDLELFPARYGGVSSVRFQAGLGLQATHLGLWLLAGLRRARLVPALQRAAPTLRYLGQKLAMFGDGRSAMFVRVSGLDRHGKEHARRWQITAGSNHGQNIPCLAAVALTRKLVAGRLLHRGATPCVGLLTLAEYTAELEGLDYRTQVA